MYLYLPQCFVHEPGLSKAVTPGHLMGDGLQFLIGHIMIRLVNFDFDKFTHCCRMQ